MPAIPLPGPLQPARFSERPHRFGVRVQHEYDGATVLAHLADPGRLRELLLPNARVWIRAAGGPGRTTAWSAVLVETPEGELVPVDTTLPNRLVRVALEQGALPELAGWALLRAEAPVGASRIDFLLGAGDATLALEVKGVSLVIGDSALFPDAVTARGRRHVLDLAQRAAAGQAAAVLFLVTRRAARSVTAAALIDPAFAAALATAAAAGVRLLARRAHADLSSLTLGEVLPVHV
jgi:sugar fermentation stimulation protein A